MAKKGKTKQKRGFGLWIMVVIVIGVLYLLLRRVALLTKSIKKGNDVLDQTDDFVDNNGTDNIVQSDLLDDSVVSDDTNYLLDACLLQAKKLWTPFNNLDKEYEHECYKKYGR